MKLNTKKFLTIAATALSLTALSNANAMVPVVVHPIIVSNTVTSAAVTTNASSIAINMTNHANQKSENETSMKENKQEEDNLNTGLKVLCGGLAIATAVTSVLAIRKATEDINKLKKIKLNS
jgi:hypothetical protein